MTNGLWLPLLLGIITRRTDWADTFWFRVFSASSPASPHGRL
jgi:hypothetical protein